MLPRVVDRDHTGTFPGCPGCLLTWHYVRFIRISYLSFFYAPLVCSFAGQRDQAAPSCRRSCLSVYSFPPEAAAPRSGVIPIIHVVSSPNLNFNLSRLKKSNVILMTSPPS